MQTLPYSGPPGSRAILGSVPMSNGAGTNGGARTSGERTMRVGVVSTYPPRPCGIGTFSRDLREALLGADGVSAVDLVAIVREDDVEQASEVVTRIHQDQRGDYAAAARVLERRGDDVVVIQHEYGIFGGHDGAHILSLAAELRAADRRDAAHGPERPIGPPGRDAARAVRSRDVGVRVHRDRATNDPRRAVGLARAGPCRAARRPVGTAPGRRCPRPESRAYRAATAAWRRARSGTDRSVLATFGLISPGKGIEVAIAAMPAIVARHPNALYVIAGQTHPEVAKLHGEEYRISLERLARDLDLGDHVVFDDRFLSMEDLSAMLADTTIYLTPYRSREQIVSGALTFAIVAGCPTVSTPYFYAEDVLASGAGVLVPFDDPAGAR